MSVEIINYKDFIGKKIFLKVSYSKYAIEGVLLRVYSDVLVIQGLTMWGVLDKDITAFEVKNEQIKFEFDKRF